MESRMAIISWKSCVTVRQPEQHATLFILQSIRINVLKHGLFVLGHVPDSTTLWAEHALNYKLQSAIKTCNKFIISGLING